ncbi:hypothetical protein MKW98_024050 [Papaver atlanticum]|uniref:Transmembrane protein n=1 Tax=Papaver atlanticum TaxID=357466 RepID=A0AAD4SZY3_9MAGN|nr:hypothetical protein MKW98_024050 [Papaver atlanticum]
MEKKHYETSSLSAKVLNESTEFFMNTYVFLSSLTSHPLFSITVALYSLILLYFPRFFLSLIFSPVLISTGVIISTLLRLGTIPKLENGNDQFLSTTSISDHEVLEFISCESEKTTEKGDTFTDKKSSFFSESFVEYWNLSAPLDVIYEEYEGQEEDGKEEVTVNEFSCLGRYFPESDDSGSESDGDFDLINGWDSPKNMCYRWEDEEDGKEGGLIEIKLNDEKRNSFDDHRFYDYHDDDDVEEMDDNLIEIEIS